MKENVSARRFKETLELVTSIIVIAAVLLFGFVVYRSSIHPAEAVQAAEPEVGTVLPALPGYSWGQHGKTLVLAMRTGCHLCEDSLPFYREIFTSEKVGKSKAYLVSVLPDAETAATNMLQTHSWMCRWSRRSLCRNFTSLPRRQ